jgi:hypothetical protein
MNSKRPAPIVETMGPSESGTPVPIEWVQRMGNPWYDAKRHEEVERRELQKEANDLARLYGRLGKRGAP